METLSNISNVRQNAILAFLLAPIYSISEAYIEAKTHLHNNLSAVRKGAVSESVVIDLIIAFLLTAILFPIAQAQIVSATTTLWNSSVVTMFAVLLPILVIIAIVYHFLKG